MNNAIATPQQFESKWLGQTVKPSLTEIDPSIMTNFYLNIERSLYKYIWVCACQKYEFRGVIFSVETVQSPDIFKGGLAMIHLWMLSWPSEEKTPEKTNIDMMEWASEVLGKINGIHQPAQLASYIALYPFQDPSMTFNFLIWNPFS